MSYCFFFFSSRRRHTRYWRDWSSDVCSSDLIADAVEYMVNAHCADALVCISNCDKITPGMLIAALRLNIPTVFVSGGPMEAGKTVAIEGVVHEKLDLVDAMVAASNDAVTDEQIGRASCR